ncbi:hypothetical protein ACFLQQ_04845, partial [Actinomycetota bacterium]
ILNHLGASLVSAGLQSFFKIVVLVAAGFCIGLIPMLLLAPGMKRSRFNIKNLLLIGLIPFVLLILSPGPVIDFIASRIFGNNENIKELLFYLLSRQAILAIWLGFAVGTSVRIYFGKRVHKHSTNYTLVGKEIKETGQDKNLEDPEAF